MRPIVNALASLALSSFLVISSGAAAQSTNGPIKQPDPYGCGPAAAANCVNGGLDFYKGVCKKLPKPDVVKNPREDWNNGWGGVSRTELCDALNAYDDGNDWTVVDKGTIKDLKEICEGDKRAVVLIPDDGTNPGHFLTACEVVGPKKNPQVTVIDPADGKKKRKKLVEPIVIIYPTPK